jgi:hypothetical protein
MKEALTKIITTGITNNDCDYNKMYYKQSVKGMSYYGYLADLTVRHMGIKEEHKADFLATVKDADSIESAIALTVEAIMAKMSK